MSDAMDRRVGANPFRPLPSLEKELARTRERRIQSRRLVLKEASAALFKSCGKLLSENAGRDGGVVHAIPKVVDNGFDVIAQGEVSHIDHDPKRGFQKGNALLQVKVGVFKFADQARQVVVSFGHRLLSMIATKRSFMRRPHE